jgi:hypothetical protein
VKAGVLALLVLDPAQGRRWVRVVCHRERGDVRGKNDESFGESEGLALELLDRWSRIHRHYLENGGGRFARWLG